MLFQKINIKNISFHFTERLESQAVDPSSISYQDVGISSLSLFSTSVYHTECNKTASIESIANKENKKGRFGLSRMKNATKCAAKKFNRILVKAKSKLIKPSLQTQSADVSIVSSCTELTEVDSCYEDAVELEEIDLNEVSRFSSQSTMFDEDWNRRHINGEHRLSKDSFHSTLTTISCSGFDSSFQSTSLNSSTNTSLMHQIFTESIADLNTICAQNETFNVKPREVKKFMRKGTPYKLKMPQQLTLYDETEPPAPEEKSENSQTEVVSLENSFDFCEDAVDLPVQNSINEKNIDPEPKLEPKKLFTQKESISKRVARTCREIFQHVLKTQAISHSDRLYYYAY